MPRKGGGFLGGKGGLLEGCCVSMEVCRKEMEMMKVQFFKFAV